MKTRTKFIHFGFASLALVVRDQEGRPYSARYDQVNAMLLNEHKTVQEQEAMIARQ